MRYIILALLFYFIYKYAKYLTRSFSKPSASSQNSSEGKVRVNSTGKSKKFGDGEYIEFEEVK